jgi:hypothetical protein
MHLFRGGGVMVHYAFGFMHPTRLRVPTSAAPR